MQPTSGLLQDRNQLVGAETILHSMAAEDRSAASQLIPSPRGQACGQVGPGESKWMIYRRSSGVPKINAARMRRTGAVRPPCAARTHFINRRSCKRTIWDGALGLRREFAQHAARLRCNIGLQANMRPARVAATHGGTSTACTMTHASGATTRGAQIVRSLRVFTKIW